jgi:uncharacterized membrane protein
MNTYKKILLVLIPFLFLNIAYNLNPYSFKEDIKNTMTYQVFKDLKTEGSIDIEQSSNSISKYIDEVLRYELEKRNSLVDSLLAANISLIVICLLSWLFHYVYIQKNKKAIILKGLTVLSICWLIITSIELKLKVFLGSGLLPIVLIFGVIWVIEEFRKNKPVN